MDEKCPIHRQNSARRYNVLEGGEVIQWNVLACDTCIGNTPHLRYKLVTEVKVRKMVGTNFMEESAKKFEG